MDHPDTIPVGSPQEAPSAMQSVLLRAFVRESNRIEGITRAPTKKEIEAHKTLLAHGAPDVGALRAFVWAVAGKPLRDRPGMNVRVGEHIAPPGGPDIEIRLGFILYGAHRGDDPYAVHQDYEHLHPFLDGNGRSGRALWLWMMLRQGRDPYVLMRGFLHTWYYQSLSAHRRDGSEAVHTGQLRDEP